MKQNKIIVCCMLLAMISCNSIPSAEVMCYDLRTEDGLSGDPMAKQYLNDRLFTGSCYTLHEQDITQIDEIRSYKKGKSHGVWVKYHNNGNIFYKSSAKNGEIHGLYNSYHINGVKADEGKMNKGYKDGVWEYFGVNGTLYKKDLYKNKKLIDEEYY